MHDYETKRNTLLSENAMELQVFESKTQAERDTSPEHPDVTNKELWSWYLFGCAYEAYSTAALAVFIPLILEEIAWQAGTLNPNDATLPPCPDRSALSEGQIPPECFIKFGTGWTSTVSFALYISSISVGVQVFSFITLGSFADYGKWRKAFMLIFGFINAISSLCYLLIFSPKLYSLAAALAVIGNVAFGTAIVFYNAYLPVLVDAHPKVRAFKFITEKKIEETEHIETFAKTEANIEATNGVIEALEHDVNDVRERMANEISTRGLIIGNSGGVIALMALSALFYFAKTFVFGELYLLQFCVALTGVWYLVFMFGFTAPWLEVRQGPEFPVQGAMTLVFGWKKTALTIASCYKLKNTFFSLLSWFFYSDGIATIAMVAILFGKSELNMKNYELLVIAIIAPFMAVLGNFFFLEVFHKRLNFSTKSMVILLVSLLALIPVYGLIGFVVPQGVPIGLHVKAEMYGMAAYFGFLLGAIQSFSRVLFTELVPPGMESEFFALYEITDRGSSCIGPLLVGALTNAFGSIRYGFFALIVLFTIAIPFIILVNPEQGKKDAKNFETRSVE